MCTQTKMGWALVLSAVLAGSVSAQPNVDDFETGSANPAFNYNCNDPTTGGPGMCEISDTFFGSFALPSYMLAMQGSQEVVTFNVRDPVLAASVDVLDFGGGFNPDAGTTSIDFIGVNGTRRFGNDIIHAHTMVTVAADQDTLDDTGTTPIGAILQINIEVGLSAAYDNITIDTNPPQVYCLCDWNQDGAYDVFDLLAYLDDWFGMNGTANINGDRSLDVFDLLEFLTCWFEPTSYPADGCGR